MKEWLARLSPTVAVLGVISVVDYLFVPEPGASNWLWAMYGFYRLLIL